MDFREKELYHQIHPLKLATDIGVTPLAVYFVWEHRVLPALLVGFVPPLVVSLAMLKWTPDLEKLKASAFGRYIKKYMTPFIELTRLLTLVPMAYGAWNHNLRFVVLGLVILVVAWCYGLIWQAFHTDDPLGHVGLGLHLEVRAHSGCIVGKPSLIRLRKVIRPEPQQFQ